MSHKSAPQECLTGVSYRSIPQECPARVSHKSFLPACPTRVSHKNVPQKCPVRVSHKSFLQERPTRVSRKSVLQECHLDICSFVNVLAFGFVGSILFYDFFFWSVYEFEIDYRKIIINVSSLALYFLIRFLFNIYFKYYKPIG